MSAGMPLRARILGVLRNRCTCLMPGERSTTADDLCRAAEIDRDALKAERDWLDSMLCRAMQVGRRFRAERDRYRQALESIADMVDGHHEGAYQAAHDALDSDPDLAERTRRIRADE